MTVGRRAAGLGLALAASAATALAAAGRVWDAAALTLTAAVGIINTLWLEGVLPRVLQPGKPRVSRGSAAILFGRLALWGLLFTALFAIRARISVWAVVGGVACFLAALAVVGAGRSAEDPGEE